ncbi:MAG: Gfo/Idh/MocA family oxidoreductase [Chloroflexota bacterium]
MDEIRIAVVGMGSRGAGTWLSLLQQMEGYRVTAICDPMVALHERAIARLKRPSEVQVYRRYEEVLADPHVDAVGLAVRCREQGALAAQALEAGKHVHAAFRDAVLGVRPPAFDVYQAMDTAAPAILAADSIAQGSRLLPVPDFRPSAARPAGQEPR